VNPALQARLDARLYDDSGVAAGEVAIYTLADPRDMRAIRYIGQTGAPRQRLRQHLNAARLWLPEQPPWWVKSPRLRPLYEWIRELYRDGERLPVMVICAWVEARQARRAEREHICACLERQLPLLNVETRLVGRQRLLI
jgi:hypothetical protein